MSVGPPFGSILASFWKRFGAKIAPKVALEACLKPSWGVLLYYSIDRSAIVFCQWDPMPAKGGTHPPLAPPLQDAFKPSFGGPYSLHIIKDPYYFTWKRHDERTHTPYDPLKDQGVGGYIYIFIFIYLKGLRPHAADPFL